MDSALIFMVAAAAAPLIVASFFWGYHEGRHTPRRRTSLAEQQRISDYEWAHMFDGRRVE